MAILDELKSLLDNRMKAGAVQAAILKGIAEEILDPVKDIVIDAQDIRDPLLTARPEDLRAKYDIPGTPKGRL